MNTVWIEHDWAFVTIREREAWKPLYDGHRVYYASSRLLCSSQPDTRDIHSSAEIPQLPKSIYCVHSSFYLWQKKGLDKPTKVDNSAVKWIKYWHKTENQTNCDIMYILESYPTFFLWKPGGFQWRTLTWGDFRPSYASVNFFPLVNGVSWWQAAFEWGSV